MAELDRDPLSTGSDNRGIVDSASVRRGQPDGPALMSSTGPEPQQMASGESRRAFQMAVWEPVVDAEQQSPLVSGGADLRFSLRARKKSG